MALVMVTMEILCCRGAFTLIKSLIVGMTMPFMFYIINHFGQPEKNELLFLCMCARACVHVCVYCFKTERGVFQVLQSLKVRIVMLLLHRWIDVETSRGS